MKDYFVLVLVALVVVVSGCAQNEDVRPSNSTNNTPEGPDEAREELGETGEPNISVVSFESSKDEYRFDENVTFDIRIQNTGGDSGHFGESIEYAYGRFNYSGYDPVPDIGVETEVDAGETVDVTRSFKWGSVEDLKFRFADKTAQVDIVAKNRSLGETHKTLAGYRNVTFEEFEMKEELEREEGGGTLTPEENWEDKFLLVKIAEKNIADQKIESGIAIQTLTFTNENMTEYSTDSWQTSATENYKEYDPGKTIEPGETFTGWLAYEIPQDTEREDVTFKYETDYGRHVVYWHR